MSDYRPRAHEPADALAKDAALLSKKSVQQSTNMLCVSEEDNVEDKNELEVQRLNQELKNKTSYIEYLEEEFSELRIECNRLKQPQRNLETKIESRHLSAELDENAQIAALREELDDLVAENEQLLAKNKSLEYELKHKTDELKEAEKALIQHSELIKSQSDYYNEQSLSESENYENEINDVHESLLNIRHERDSLKQSFTDTCKQNLLLRSELEQAKSELKTSMENTEELQKSLVEIKTEKKYLKNELQDSIQLSELENSLMPEEMDGQLKNRVLMLEKQLFDSENENQELRENDQVVQLEETLKKTQVKFECQFDEQISKVQELQNELEQSEKELSLFKSAHYENLEDEIETAQSEIDIMELKLTQTAPVAEELQTHEARELELVKSSILTLKDDNLKLKNELELLKSEPANQDEILELEEEIKQNQIVFQEILTESFENNENLQRQLNMFKSMYSSVNTENMSETAPIAEHLETYDRQNCELMKSNILVLQQENLKLKDEIELLKSRITLDD